MAAFLEPGRDPSLIEICKMMPKVELHAHLNGSITDEIVDKLKRLSQKPSNKEAQVNEEQRRKDDPASSRSSSVRVNTSPSGNRSLSEYAVDSLDYFVPIPTLLPVSHCPALCDDLEKSLWKLSFPCWKAFARVHEVIRTPNLLYAATCAVIKDFVEDNVVYLELRTTPKKVHDIPSKKVYIETVVRAIRHCTLSLKLPITVKLLVSIDRGLSARHHLENACLARWYMEKYPDIIVGVDLCGDPTKGDTHHLIFALNFCKKLGLKSSIHMPEIINIEESKRFLLYRPDRVAHGHFLHPSRGGSEELWKILKDTGVCMEVCITSNLISGVCSTMEEHYVKILHNDRLPFIICTDDCGAFDSKLSQEYEKFLELVPLSTDELRAVCLNSVNFIFGSDKEKIRLLRQITSWWDAVVVSKI